MHFSEFLFKLLFISILAFLTHTFISQKIKILIIKSLLKEKQNQNTNRRQMMESSPPDFSWGHP